MKRYLLSLLCAALASTAWGQSPVQVSAMPETNTVIPAGTAAAASAITATTGQGATANVGHCDGGKCSKRGVVCVPVADKVTKTKVCFSSDCEVKCHKSPFCFLHRGGDCGSCPDGKCGHAHVERYLYKRVQTETCDSFKCVPTQCGSTCANGVCVRSGAVPSGTVQVIPPGTETITPVSAVTPRR
jgi:hypothetical protein